MVHVVGNPGVVCSVKNKEGDVDGLPSQELFQLTLDIPGDVGVPGQDLQGSRERVPGHLIEPTSLTLISDSYPSSCPIWIFSVRPESNLHDRSHGCDTLVVEDDLDCPCGLVQYLVVVVGPLVLRDFIAPL